jgi:DNA-binding NtrC family response regulator
MPARRKFMGKSDIRYPHNTDLRRLVRFSAENGTIWLAEHRMLLLHVAALADLRKELVGTCGVEHTRHLLMRMGHASGTRDAELAKRMRVDRPINEAFFVGPQLHMLEGGAQVTPVKLEMDVATGTFYGEFRWGHSWEAESHTKAFGPQSQPVCWMLLGYASGYSSAFMGRSILYKEVECSACGAPGCRIIGRPAEEWPDAAQMKSYFEADTMVSTLLELRTQVDALRSSLEQKHQIENMVGDSPAFRRAYGLVSRAAQTNVTALLTGETGVGKERFARALHQMSARAAAPFVAVNCAALPHELVESELFGVEKGAFTGAQANRAGRFERADKGTLFLDEIGELPLPAQAKLLRAIQEGEIERLGDDRTRRVNVRVIAATNVDLEAAVKMGRFRSDLYYRLNVYPILIPPLRERASDIPPMVTAMIERFGALHGKRLAGISDKALQALMLYGWPGNVRELENMIERGVILASPNGVIELDHLAPCLMAIAERESGVAPSGRLEDSHSPDRLRIADAFFESGCSLDELEALLLDQAVKQSDGNLSGAARLLGITRPQLSYRLKRNQDDPTSEKGRCPA